MKISAIVAVSENGVIGVNDALPWEPIKADMKRFRELTAGHAVIMGRKTWDSLPIKPLPDRGNIIVTKSTLLREGAWLCGSLEGSIYTAGDFLGHEKAFIIGGECLYREALPLCDEVYLTRVHCNVAIPPGAEVAIFDENWLFDQQFNCEILGRAADGKATFYRYFRIKDGD